MTLIEYKFIFTYRPIRMNWNWSMIRNRLKLLSNWKRLPKRSRRDYCGNRKTSCSVNGRNGILSSHKTTYSALRKAPPGSQKWENSYSRYVFTSPTLKFYKITNSQETLSLTAFKIRCFKNKEWPVA